MNHTANTNHDAVLRARVALLGSGTLPLRQQVAAYRLLAEVTPLAYLPRLSIALYDYSRQEFAHDPRIALALRAESLDAARRMHALEPERLELLVAALDAYRELLDTTGDTEAAEAATGELASLGHRPGFPDQRFHRLAYH
ncbi:hypothetical protein [Streptomyces globosus]|uniref:hypothetical protein n=1 Tax=Streptomyces globosus TaxID=68209 RepID=UPI0031D59F11